MSKYVDVILPLPLDNYFTYSVDTKDESSIQLGMRVIVPFGRAKLYTAIVVRLHDIEPREYKVKQVLEILDDVSIVLPLQLELWHWIAGYYICSEGDVMKAALPSGLKVEGETVLETNKDFCEVDLLSSTEKKVIDLLNSEKQISISQLKKKIAEKHLLQIVEALIECKAICVSEQLHDLYRPKTEIKIRLHENVDKTKLDEVYKGLSSSPKQLKLLAKYVELSEILKGGKDVGISRNELLQAVHVVPSVLKSLISKKIFDICVENVDRLDKSNGAVASFNNLNEYQQKAYDEINGIFLLKNVCLLYGVTSSGKTEIYIHLIQDILKEGKQVLYLLPEIALTTQITIRLKRVFGSRLGIYHSKFSDAERVEIWKKQLSEQPYEIILGVRSSVLLPFKNLGLVIVDEEHEQTYKQQDPAPRYHARNTAIVLASKYGAKTLLGTATPSVETWYNVEKGKYGLVELLHRYENIQLPEIIPVDMADKKKRRQVTGIFSFDLLEYVRAALESHEQIILFQNRRGFAPMIICHTCGWVPKCACCDVSLTYHQRLHQLTCHYCGYAVNVPSSCPACGSTQLLDKGFGTEKVEEEIQKIFPKAKIARMDLDTTRTRNGYERIINDFECGKLDILIGTQMVSKGLDFDKVSVVGILDADTMLNYPDFRSYEHAFQLMAQVAGRSGRKGKRGSVIVQTRNVEQPIIQQIIRHDYSAMIEVQLNERKQFNYPPYCHLVYVYVKHRQEKYAQVLADVFASKLRKIFGDRVVGPDLPPVARVQSYHIRKIVLKIEQKASLADALKRLRNVRQELMKDKVFNSSITYYDVDPM